MDDGSCLVPKILQNSSSEGVTLPAPNVEDAATYMYLELQGQPIFLWLFQADDSKSLHKKWLFHQTSI